MAVMTLDEELAAGELPSGVYWRCLFCRLLEGLWVNFASYA